MKKKHENLYQLHLQERAHPYKVVEFIAQREIKTGGEMREWQESVAKRHPLPDSMCWLICSWDSEHFIKTQEVESC